MLLGGHLVPEWRGGCWYLGSSCSRAVRWLKGAWSCTPGDAPWAPAILHLSWVQEPSELRFLNIASNERVDGVTMIVRTDVTLGDQ